MDSREMYNATSHMIQLVIWDKDWIHFGTENEIKFDLLEKLIKDHLKDEELLFIYGRTTSEQLKKEKIIEKIKPLLGTDEFQLWSPTMDNVIQFNKIGVLKVGQKKYK
ncbi:hypothetical protein [Pararhodonellum marinum]|uniref:hypothetical protein n=1 Tax=Pararhodonellum marinum TaxID=2755358 RepID=UPI00188F4E5F|nr:hypothetical protein [Pararhodonellum marinum]